MLKQFLSLAIICLVFVSCKQDPCEDVNCNNGTCESGNCICETGYEGLNCEVEQRQAFVGDYAVSESCDLGNFNYVINVTADSEVGNDLTIHNIGDFDFDVIANVDGSSFSLDNVNVTGGTINGMGNLTGTTLDISYIFETTSGQSINCSMTCTLIE